jgi:hypothetical protein
MSPVGFLFEPVGWIFWAAPAGALFSGQNFTALTIAKA